MTCSARIAARSRPISFPEGTETLPYGVNDRGQVVGSYRDPTGAVKGFLFENGTYISVSIGGSATTNFYDINSAGAIAGLYSGSSGQHGFVWRNGSLTTIDVPGAAATYPAALNDNGTVVGMYVESGDGPEHGFIYRRGRFTTVDYPGGINTVLRKISNTGAVFGSSFTGTGTVDFLYVRGTFLPISGCQPQDETLIGITPKGEPFGFVATDGGNTAGFVLTRRQYTLIQPPAATRVLIRDADARFATGEYYDGTRSRGFVYVAKRKASDR